VEEKRRVEEEAINAWQLKECKRREHEKEIIHAAKLEEKEQEELERRKREQIKKEFEAEQWKKQNEQEKAKQEKEVWFVDEMRHRMAKAGYHNADIERAVFGKSEYYCHKHRTQMPCYRCSLITDDNTPYGYSPLHSPVFIKVHREHLCPETLRYYNLPWEWDKVRDILNISHCSSPSH
jgi:hypothetical protein